MKRRVNRGIGWLLSAVLVLSLFTCMVFAQDMTDTGRTTNPPKSLIILNAGFDHIDALLRGADNPVTQTDFEITTEYGTEKVKNELTQFNYDEENQIAHITFQSIVCDDNYTGNISVTLKYKELTDEYIFPANHTISVEQEVRIESIEAGSVYRPAHDPDYCMPDKLIDGSYLTPNDFTGKHGNHIWGYGMWMTADNPGENAWVEAMFDREYVLENFYIWNYNQSGDTNWRRGLRDIKIEYYQDGEWKTLQGPNEGEYSFRLEMAQGIDGSEAQIIPMKGIRAEGIRITADPTPGVGNYAQEERDYKYGLSEIKLSTEEKIPYQITLEQTAGGTISADKTSVQEGSTVIFTINTMAGYQLEKLYVNGQDKSGDLTGNKLTLSDVSADIKVVPVFRDELGEGPFNFYVDPENGSDDNSGISEDAPLKSMEPLRDRYFGAGDQILLKAGTTLTDTITPQGSGTEQAPIVISRYGEGDDPVLEMPSEAAYGINLTNVEYWEIRSIAITSELDQKEEIERNSSRLRAAIFIYNNDAGILNHVYVMDCHIYDIPTYIPPSGGYAARFFGGIFVNIGVEGTGGKENKYVDLQLKRNRIERTSQCGIYFQSYDIANNGSWDYNLDVHSEKVQVSDNYVDSVGGDGIMVGWSTGALIEHNIVHNACANDIDSYAALWVANLHDSVIQYNECYNTKSWADGMAFDDDLFCSGNTYQYNYSHDNRGGFFMSMGSSPDSTIRYNISYNDGHLTGYDATRLITGSSQGTRFYNNIIYTPEGNDAVLFDRGVGPIYATFQNNIFYFDGNNTRGLDGGVWDHNLFYGNAIGNGFSLPDDENAVLDDPLFNDPESAGIGFESVKEAFKLMPGSPAVDAGVQIDHGEAFTEDFYGNGFADGTPDIGVEEVAESEKIERRIKDVLYANNGTVKLMLTPDAQALSKEDALIQLSTDRNNYRDFSVTSVEYDDETGIAVLQFEPATVSQDEPVTVKIRVKWGEEISPSYTFVVNHELPVEQEVTIESIEAGSVERPAHDPDYCMPDKLIDGSYLTPNDFTGKHGNHVYGYGMWMTADNPGENAWVEAMFDREYVLENFYIWNYNQSGDTNWRRGLRDIKIEYYQDGEWKTLQGPNEGEYSFRLEMAPGTEEVAAQIIPMEGIRAEGIRITADPTPGIGNYAEVSRDYKYGLSEIKLSTMASIPYIVTVGNTENGIVTANLKEAAKGEVVVLSVTPNEGYALKNLYVNGENLVSQVTKDGTLELKDIQEDVKIFAEFEAGYFAAVENGSGSGSYQEGDIVTITANTAPEGKEFDKWVSSDGVEFADAGSESTTFVMPANAVAVTATYKDSVLAKDKTELQQLYDEYSATEQGNHADELWERFKNALSKAEAVLADEAATQEEIDSAAQSLKDAYQELTGKSETAEKGGNTGTVILVVVLVIVVAASCAAAVVFAMRRRKAK